jgi:hypothetical protein
MSELIFLVEEAPEGGFIARALSQAIFTEAVAAHFGLSREELVERLWP